MTLLAGLASAACVKPLPQGRYEEPSTYEALRYCQQKERDRLVDSMLGATIGAQQAAGLKAFDARQRAEEADFVRRHPGANRLKAPEDEMRGLGLETAEPKAAEKAGPKEIVIDGAAEEPAAGAGAKGDVEALKADLMRQSPGGAHGMTPGMAQSVNAYLMQNQGYVSPDMQALLKATSEDGTNLRTSTMVKLRDAAQRAQGANLNLGLDANTENQLLRENLNGNPEYPSGGQPSF